MTAMLKMLCVDAVSSSLRVSPAPFKSFLGNAESTEEDSLGPQMALPRAVSRVLVCGKKCLAETSGQRVFEIALSRDTTALLQGGSMRGAPSDQLLCSPYCC
jgi:hypothetical protein